MTDVNAADVSKDKQVIATGDDFGFVKLYNYPSKVSNLQQNSVNVGILQIVRLDGLWVR